MEKEQDCNLPSVHLRPESNSEWPSLSLRFEDHLHVMINVVYSGHTHTCLRCQVRGMNTVCGCDPQTAKKND